MKSRWILLGTLVTVLLVLAAGLSQAQGPQPPDVEPTGGAGPEVAVGNVIPIQGYLTDSAGNPLNGNYSITAHIYDVSSGGTALCSDTETVAVNNGLFTMDVNNCTSNDVNGRQLYLGIQVGSDAEMTPRRPIYPVPYAMSLMPGARIEDTAYGRLLEIINHDGQALRAYSENSYGIYGRTNSPDYAGVGGEGFVNGSVGVYGVSPSYGVFGYTTGATGIGVYGKADATSGVNYGVYGESMSTNGIGVQGRAPNRAIFGAATASSGTTYGVYGQAISPDGFGGYFFNNPGGVALKAAGSGIIQSTAKSYLWISGNALQKANSTDTTVFEYDLYGGYLVKGGSDWSNNKTVLVPVTIPGQLYGQNVTITGLDLYYNTSDDVTGITVSAMRRQNGVGAGDLIFWDGTDYICVEPTRCVQHWDLTTNNVLSDERGILYIAFQLSFGGPNAYVHIGGVRLTLEHD